MPAARHRNAFHLSAVVRELSPPPTSGLFQPALYALSYTIRLCVPAAAGNAF